MQKLNPCKLEISNLNLTTDRIHPCHKSVSHHYSSQSLPLPHLPTNTTRFKILSKIAKKNTQRANPRYIEDANLLCEPLILESSRAHTKQYKQKPTENKLIWLIEGAPDYIKTTGSCPLPSPLVLRSDEARRHGRDGRRFALVSCSSPSSRSSGERTCRMLQLPPIWLPP